MEDKMKYIIGALLLVVIGVVLFFVFKPKDKDNNPLKNTTIDGVKITNVNIKSEVGVYHYKAELLATKDVNIDYIKINITKDGKTTELVGYVGKELKTNETAAISSSTDVDITNPEKVEYSIVYK